MIDSLLAKGAIPDFLLRKGVRRLLNKRLDSAYGSGIDFIELERKKIITDLKESPVAIETDKANDQHYMVDPEFFFSCLGERLKYSCCHWEKATNLEEAEEEMLELTVQRANIKDGDKILELGHGWGAITLYMAEKFPNSSITAVSNSSYQREIILKKAEEKGLSNIKIITADVATLELDEKFDRIISVEMFEHMRNYQTLLQRIDGWLNVGGTLFVHIFVHKEVAYKYEVIDETDWMSKYYFSGGLMPSEHLLYYFQDHLTIKEHWRVSGTHYAKTCRAWLSLMDRNKNKILNIFKKSYNGKDVFKWFNYWRVFFISCEELFNYKKGSEWFVGHYLIEKKSKR